MVEAPAPCKERSRLGAKGALRVFQGRRDKVNDARQGYIRVMLTRCADAPSPQERSEGMDNFIYFLQSSQRQQRLDWLWSQQAQGEMLWWVRPGLSQGPQPELCGSRHHVGLGTPMCCCCRGSCSLWQAA